ncbi:MAG: 4'-phosphopantetheinyl transferase family protein [Eubacteriales bacterium]
MIKIEYRDISYDGCKTMSEKRRTEHFMAYDLCKDMLFLYFGIENPVFEKTSNGKPFIDNGGAFFSISHTENRVYCAVSDKNIGIDAEFSPGKSDKKIQKFANRFFAVNEIEFIEKEGFSEKAFFEVWTKKEAYIKLKDMTLADIKKIDTTKLNIKTYTDGKYTVSIAEE